MSYREAFFHPIYQDFLAQMRGRQGIKAVIASLFFGRGFHTLLSYRLQRVMIKLPFLGKILAKILRYISCAFTGCDISYHATLLGGIYIPHPTGIVIADNVLVGEGTTILQQVTLGTRIKGGKDYPTIGQNVYLGAGCKILGSIVIGDGALIGANSVVLSNIPPYTKAVGVPARILDQTLTNTQEMF